MLIQGVNKKTPARTGELGRVSGEVYPDWTYSQYILRAPEIAATCSTKLRATKVKHY